MDNLVFDGRGDSLLGGHSKRGGGWGRRGEALGESNPARAPVKETNGGGWQKKKQTNKQTTPTKSQKKDKEHMVEIK